MGNNHTGTPPAYGCGCAPYVAGLTWQLSDCPPGSVPVAAPNNICRVNAGGWVMGWLDASTQTCYFPKQPSKPDGKAVGFGGWLYMGQLCYASGAHRSMLGCNKNACTAAPSMLMQSLLCYLFNR